MCQVSRAAQSHALPHSKSSVSTEPAFKPRKVKKAEPKYRDRAAERRVGIGNDYAQIEAVLEDFEKRGAHEDKDALEQQRKYLGGDSEHTILVKGLDMSLLEQNRARAAPSTEDDDILEQAFVEAASTSPAVEPRKRTREDIIRDLKAKRQNGSGDQAAKESVPVEESIIDDRLALEAAKKAGKFKPIGQTEEKAKKRKGKGEKEGEKKKRKVGSLPQQSEAEGVATGESLPAHAERKVAEFSAKATERQSEPQLALLDENFDIFTGAGDYEGFPDGEESDGFDESRATRVTPAAEESRSPVSPSHVIKGWFDEPDLDVQQLPITASSRPSGPKSPPRDTEVQPDEDEEGELRLKPLESSTLPFIREFLAIDEAAEKAEKRRARKEKKKKKKKDGDDDDD
ncbi:hypothetical protein PAXRUDRAFT_30277 [Paxillus rubicundulus Ve08.2h10]|uniref:RED-like N-terminal domain-containing protein n=1 Tax=Paxillus rubicundulus Ve08.2h10 TaxID=930991 RepID=A0A0D0DM99_9AGAM|nr:hypothetical protein PAXRUDRAFT_30277 [Paxillus rubicundulus Ve08.2h10]